MLKAKHLNQNTIWVKTLQGTFMYALYQKDTLVHVGQCHEVQGRIDQHFKDKDILFDRFTYTFIPGMRPFSSEANLMEAVAIARMKPKTDTTPASGSSASIAPKPVRYQHLDAEDTQTVA
ncbi:hypothetical protein I2I11_14245 [Pontibacter sp. 172403-2]|uniref:hypothetical protein n=1 Tax=Pontibacter rufus TaxID=2791028 RepID=UPI0018AF781B|nr:hypothetical protein [Pontibacter sp. 172403-2]MBF9254461.1 hypothetical protein [Pontibacter sp. 172403-2]